MKINLRLIIVVLMGHIACLSAVDYQELYENGKVDELRSAIYSKPHFDEEELPRAAFYESLVTSKNFDTTLQELIEGFPEIDTKDQINFKLGIINFFQRKYSQAEFFFTKVENRDQFYEFNYWLARLYYMKQDHKNSSLYASKFIEKCEKIDHKYELSFYMLIENSISDNNFQKAVVLAEELLLKKAEGINKKYLYYRIGYSYERLENISLAVANYKKSFELDPYGQYAALTEERLFELQKSSKQNLDLSFLYTKNYPPATSQMPVAQKTSVKEFNITELVRTDTSTVLNKFFNGEYKQDNHLDIIHTQDKTSKEDLSSPKGPEELLVSNNLEMIEENIEIKTNDSFNTVADNDIIGNPGQESRGINPNQSHSSQESPNGTFLERPKNIEKDGYVYLMNKPVGNYFVQIGRFSTKESAINRTKELFFLQKTWNIIRDVSNEKITYMIWTHPYDTANQAKNDIAYFKSKGIDCFLISNE
ncbi:SPOR domain-containing protein [bacterium]|nr:SPOR domain-containing protein [bacterium]